MARKSLANTRNLLPALLILTLVGSLAPPRWLRWTNDLSDIIRMPITPFGEAGGWLAARLRPPQPAADLEDIPDVARPTVEFYREQAERFKQLYHAESARTDDLRRQLEQLQRIPADLAAQPVVAIVATVTGRTPGEPIGSVELNRGERHGVLPGVIVVVDGVHLLGRVTDTDAMRSRMTPLTNPTTGLLAARVLPHDRTSIALADAVRVQLEPAGDGTFRGDVHHDVDVAVGDEVRLDDRAWPDSARALIVGTVTEIIDRDDQPLRRRIIVRPVHQAHRMTYVSLHVEQDEQMASGGGGS